ncbi:MAG: hypothetical protein ACE5KI_00615 [Dehalococcoidia bacterium]
MPKFKKGQKVKVTKYLVDSSLVGQEGYIDGMRGEYKSGPMASEGSTGLTLASSGEMLYVVKLRSPPRSKPPKISVAESGLELIVAIQQTKPSLPPAR